jgi:dUTP pyrophosphatase
VKYREILQDRALVPIFVRSESRYGLPEYSTSGASGFDLRANLEAPIVLKPFERAVIPTGLYLEIPDGFEIQIRPRSGLAVKNGITVLNTPGTIDADYRGEIKVILVNLGVESFTINPGDRIAQAVLCPVFKAAFLEAETLSQTERNTGGFGSTGVK